MCYQSYSLVQFLSALLVYMIVFHKTADKKLHVIEIIGNRNIFVSKLGSAGKNGTSSNEQNSGMYIRFPLFNW